MTPSAPRRRLRPGALMLAFALAAGCGGGEAPVSELTFDALPDTAGLSQGDPIVEGFEVIRMDNGAIRVEGSADLPDGTRLQIAIRAPEGGASLAMSHALVERRRFGTPPLLGAYGPLPKGRYQVEVRARFTPEWQSPDVMRATDGGRALRGPGISRARDGAPAFHLSEEVTR